MLVKVLGTFILEGDKGAEICQILLATKESTQMYAEKLAELASALGFDGWLVSGANFYCLLIIFVCLSGVFSACISALASFLELISVQLLSD